METASVVKVYAQAPCEALRPFVKRFLVIESSSAQKIVACPTRAL